MDMDNNSLMAKISFNCVDFNQDIGSTAKGWNHVCDFEKMDINDRDFFKKLMPNATLICKYINYVYFYDNESLLGVPRVGGTCLHSG